MTVEKRDKRIVLYLTESEYEVVNWAADRARRRPSEAIRLVAIDWANSQVERAHQWTAAAGGLPPCSRCQKTDRMARLPDTTTDFSGVVGVWVCQRCGIVAVLTRGERPSKEGR